MGIFAHTAGDGRKGPSDARGMDRNGVDDGLHGLVDMKTLSMTSPWQIREGNHESCRRTLLRVSCY